MCQHIGYRGAGRDIYDIVCAAPVQRQLLAAVLSLLVLDSAQRTFADIVMQWVTRESAHDSGHTFAVGNTTTTACTQESKVFCQAWQLLYSLWSIVYAIHLHGPCILLYLHEYLA